MAGRFNRAQAPQLAGPEPLRPAPLPGDTYAAPARPPIDNNLARMADALGVFNHALLQWGSSTAALERKQQHETDMAIANKTIAGYTNADYINLGKEGKLPRVLDPFARAALDKHYGYSVGEGVIQNFTDAVKSGQLDLTNPNVNVDQMVTQSAREALDGMGAYANNNPALAGFRERIAAGRDALLKQQQSDRAQAFLGAQIGMAREQFGKAFDMAQGDRDGTQKLVRGLYSDLGPNSASKMPNSVLDQALLTVVKERSRNPNSVDAALHVLYAPREANGKPLPALASNPKYAQEVFEIKKIALGAKSKKFDQDVETTAIKEVTDDLKRQDGSYWFRTDHTYRNPYNGETKTLSSDDIKKKAVQSYITASHTLAAVRGESDETRFERDWAYLGSADVANPEWKNRLEGSAKAFTTPAALSDPAKRADAIGAANLYLKIAERNHPYIESTLKLDSNSKDFYRVFDVAKNQLGKNDDEALDMAAHSIRTTDNKDDLAVRQARAKEVRDKVATMNAGTGVLSYVFGTSVKNQGAVSKRVSDVASVLTRAGLGVDDAVKAAFDSVKARTFFINGYAVPNNGFMPPPQMAPMIEQQLNKFAKDHGKEFNVTNGGQLSIEPAGGGNFRIIKADDPIPHPLYAKDQDGHVVPALITMSMLQAIQNGKDADTAKKIQDEQQKNMRDIQNGSGNIFRVPKLFDVPAWLEQHGF